MANKLSKKRQAIFDKSGGVCWYCGDPPVVFWFEKNNKKVNLPEFIE